LVCYRIEVCVSAVPSNHFQNRFEESRFLPDQYQQLAAAFELKALWRLPEWKIDYWLVAL
jgi:hypothetical protein